MLKGNILWLPLEHKNFIPSIVSSKARDIRETEAPRLGDSQNKVFLKESKT
jgi:hypothetical protein